MIVYLLIILAVTARFFPHMPNAIPITALAIFGGAYLPKKQAVIIPLLARFISDIFLGFFAWPLMLAVYACHLAGVLFGLWIKKSSNVIPSRINQRIGEESLFIGQSEIKGSLPPSPRLRRTRPLFLRVGLPDEAFAKSGRDGILIKWLKIVGSSLGASVVFFLVTNFAFLYTNYSHITGGVMLAYQNGLPFFRGTLFGDLGYTLALFGGYALVQAWMKAKVQAAALEA